MRSIEEVSEVLAVSERESSPKLVFDVSEDVSSGFNAGVVAKIVRWMRKLGSPSASHSGSKFIDAFHLAIPRD